MRLSRRSEPFDSDQFIYELKVDDKSLRIEVKRGKVTVPASSSDDPDVVLEAGADVFLDLLAGNADLDDAATSGRLRLDGDRAEARRFFEMFRLPSSHDAGETPQRARAGTA